MSKKNLEVNNGQILLGNQKNSNQRFPVETEGSSKSNTRQRNNIQAVLQGKENTTRNSSRDMEGNKANDIRYSIDVDGNIEYTTYDLEKSTFIDYNNKERAIPDNLILYIVVSE